MTSKKKIKKDESIVEVELSTTTLSKERIEAPTKNIYKAISIISKRAEQINTEMRKELLQKLEEFAIPNNDDLEEIFENKEQIAVSRYYESLPKPHALAIKEWLEGEIYYRDTDKDNEENE